LSEGKKDYEQTKDNLFLMLADNLLKDGKGLTKAREQIAEGEKQVAKGEYKVNVGESRLDAGELELRQGRKQLGLAKGARVACTLGAAFFASLSIVAQSNTTYGQHCAFQLVFDACCIRWFQNW
jgi:hypothetical protein